MRARMLLVGLIAGALGLRGQVIVNGDFELPDLSSSQNFFGAFSFEGWAGQSTGGTGNAGLVVGTDFGLAPVDGSQHFSFNGNNPPPGSWLELTLPTAIGSLYDVTFHLGRNGQSPEQVLEARFVAFGAGGLELVNSLHQPPGHTGYALHTVRFLADAASTRLRWTDVSGSNASTDLFIDAVSVMPVAVAVPEPSTWVMIAGGIAGVVVAERRRRRYPKGDGRWAWWRRGPG